MPLHPWRLSRRTRAMAAMACVLASWTCDQETAGPGRRAPLAVAVLLPATDLAAFNLTIDNARLIVVRPPADTVFDKVFSFPANQSSLPVVGRRAAGGVSGDLPGHDPAALGRDRPVRRHPGRHARPPVRRRHPPRSRSATADRARTSRPSRSIPLDSALSFGGSLTFRPTARDGQGERRPELLRLLDHERHGRSPDRRDRNADRASRAAHRHRLRAHAQQRRGLHADHHRRRCPTSSRLVSGCGQSGAPGAQLPQPSWSAGRRRRTARGEGHQRSSSPRPRAAPWRRRRRR